MKLTAANGTTYDHRHLRRIIEKGLKISRGINKRKGRTEAGANLERICMRLLRRLANSPKRYKVAS